MKNDWTKKELKMLIEKIVLNKSGKEGSFDEPNYLYEYDLIKNGIPYEKVVSIDQAFSFGDNLNYFAKVYFFCKDGILSLSLDHYDEEKKEFYEILTHQYVWEEVNQKELEKIARDYQLAKQQADVYEKVLEQERLRGLFAKMKLD